MKILQRIKDGANRATEKAQGAVEINKLSSHIGDIEKEMSTHFMRMGKVFYEGYRLGDMTDAEKEMMDLCKECDTLQEDIDELRRRIAELKNERLCKCGRVASLDANFCPACGRKLGEEEPSKQGAPAKRSTEAEKAFMDDDFIDKVFGNHHDSISDDAEDKFYSHKKEYDDYDYAGEEEAGTALENEHDYDDNERWQDETVIMPSLDSERERRQAEELERERERQLELDRRIRYWKEANEGDDTVREEAVRETVKCQICRADLPKGSKWCPRCGAEQI